MINGSISEVNAARDNGVAAVNSTASAKTAEINARVNELTSAASSNKEIADMFAEAFSTSKNYTAGEYVIYTTNGVNKLYQFTVNHAAGAWKGSTDTKEVTVAGSVSDFAANLVKGQNTEPTDPNTRIWIDTDSTKSVVVPQIDDNNVSTTDTWSSSKIKSEDDGIREEVVDLKSTLLISSGNFASKASVIANLYINNSGVLTAQVGNGADRTICVNAEPDHLYTIQKETETIMRVGVGSADNLAAGTQLAGYTAHSVASNGALYVRTDATNHYIYIQLFASSDDAELQSIAANTPTLCVFVSAVTVEQSTNDKIKAVDETLGMLISEKSVYSTYIAGDNLYGTAARVFWSEQIPEKCTLTSVKVYVRNVGTNPSITVDIWDLENGVLTKAKTVVETAIVANNVNVIDISRFSDKPQMVSYTYTNCQAVFYRTNQTGHSWYYTTDVSVDTFNMSDLSKYNNMILVGGYTYQQKLNEQDNINTDFFSGYLAGNIVVFGDSTVDGTSTTGHNGNVIGVDRTPANEPNAFTSVLENMIRTFNGSSVRVYNGGFGGKTLNYIANNYAAIMAAFDNVKSALVIIDVNSAGNTREEYANAVKTEVERLIKLLQDDGVAVAVASPQPMFFYPADNNGLPAINSAGEFAIAVNIGKDICDRHNIPFINLGEITNGVMESPYFTSNTFYGDRIHFGDGGHKLEAYELYGELIHPIIYFDGAEKLIRLESNRCELSENSAIQSTVVGDYRSIVLQANHGRTDVLARFYIVSKVPFSLAGVEISGWAYNCDTYVDGDLYSEGVPTAGATIQPGAHEITIKPEVGKIVRFSGLIVQGT